MDVLKYKKRKQIQLYLRTLTALCMKNPTVAYFYTLHNFGKAWEGIIERKLIYNTLSSWEIHNEQALKLKLSWLLNDGWRKEFTQIRSFLSALSEVERTQYIQSFPEEDSHYSKLYIVNYYMNKLPKEGIAGFDYGWYIFLCRAGKTVGYLKDKEAQKFMLEAAKRIQKSYSNWEEYTTAFVCGSQFKALDDSFSFVRNNREYINKLFASKKSPVRRINWDIEL